MLCTGHRPYRGTWRPGSQALDKIGATGIMVPRITSIAYRVGGVRALASPALAVPRKVGCSLNNYWTSHLGGAGEPSGATRRPRGRPWRPPECPDGHGRLRRRSRGVGSAPNLEGGRFRTAVEGPLWAEQRGGIARTRDHSQIRGYSQGIFASHGGGRPGFLISAETSPAGGASG